MKLFSNCDYQINDRVLWVDAICIDEVNSEESSLRL